MPNPGNPRNYKGRGGSRTLDPPNQLKTDPPGPPPPLQRYSYKRGLAALPVHTLQMFIIAVRMGPASTM